MIRCKDGSLYTGITNDFRKRWKKHKNGTGSRTVKIRGYLAPVFLCSFINKSAAMCAEIHVKKQKRWHKEQMIDSSMNLIKDFDTSDI
ncbi:MAG: GIY-YIG nuclease family protein [Nanoarchaeota archaeon]|nr:GIY-YIG nuclease family protein [Nanoarchaeota archaeon]